MRWPSRSVFLRWQGVLGVAVGVGMGVMPPRGALAAPGADPSAAVGRQRYRACARGLRWWCCAPDQEVCTRPGPARLLLLSLGGVAVAGGVASLFALGDRLAGDDPSTLLVATGTFALGGAVLGAIAGRLGADGRKLEDRVRPETVGLAIGGGGSSVIDEHRPPLMLGTFAPTVRFADGNSRMRLTGYFGGILGTEVDTDPRAQASANGEAMVIRRETELMGGIGLDMAVGLPYPVLSRARSRFLGRAEIRWKPDVHIRRQTLDRGGAQERTLERSMLLPLTIGMRWHLSPRQRFTLYLGPRFDILSIKGPGDRKMRRGSAELGPLYAEVWYDIDIPLNAWPRLDGKTRRADINSQLSFAYIHSRFEGSGINFRAVIGFLGPLYARWQLRVRPKSGRLAYQATLGARLGGGFGWWAAVGIVLPDVHARKRR